MTLMASLGMQMEGPGSIRLCDSVEVPEFPRAPGEPVPSVPPVEGRDPPSAMGPWGKFRYLLGNKFLKMLPKDLNRLCDGGDVDIMSCPEPFQGGFPWLVKESISSP
jgi:hypothetical protein